MRDADGHEIRCYRVVYYVETGTVDGGGIGRWIATTESHPFADRAEAEALQNKWLSEGKLQRMRWGELRPSAPYGLFRIRRAEEPVNTTD